MIFPFMLFGELCCSEEAGLYLRATDGRAWKLDMSRSMARDADRMLYMLVVVEGGRTGISTVAVSSIKEAHWP